jgi:hypothetical protein
LKRNKIKEKIGGKRKRKVEMPIEIESRDTASSSKTVYSKLHRHSASSGNKCENKLRREIISQKCAEPTQWRRTGLELLLSVKQAK